MLDVGARAAKLPRGIHNSILEPPACWLLVSVRSTAEVPYPNIPPGAV